MSRAVSAAVPPLPHLAAPGPPGPTAPASAWRYRDAFPLPRRMPPVSLGEGFVPLEPLRVAGLPPGVLALRDDLEPTGSWKDRGSTLLVSAMRAAGIREAVEDSSGNAALSLAAYARAAGIRLRAFVPESTPDGKKALIAAAGAELVEVPGPRPAATRAARRAAAHGAWWASHAVRPLHALGAATIAFNIHERLGRVPREVVAPVGQGGLLSGLARGFEALASAGHGPMPRLVGVQSAACAPIAAACSRGDTRVVPAEPPAGRPLAEGVAIPDPARGDEALAAARRSGGRIVAVDDLAVERALRLLWLSGCKVEPTAALPVAWLLARAARGAGADAGDVVVVLTGAGIRQGRSLVDGLG
ncbi:MAG: pyridoxal-phosphate dependent enzyme [Acidobacteria bacterium]|nr:MAG: pyridoxal-phosphate dependent enzyme [Acidobacteriota bacterium]